MKSSGNNLAILIGIVESGYYNSHVVSEYLGEKVLMASIGIAYDSYLLDNFTTINSM